MVAREVSRQTAAEATDGCKDGCGCFQPPKTQEAAWAHVGQGKGSYSKVEQVRYVGDGRGSYVQELTTTYEGYQIRPCCIACFSALLLITMVTIYAVVWGQHPPMSPRRDQLVQVQQSPHLVFDCSEGADYHLWSPGQQDFCCAHAGLACSHRADSYDCDKGYEQWQSKWSAEHQRFCCYKHSKACAVKVVHDVKYVPVYHTKKEPPHYVYKTRYKTITHNRYVPVPVPTPGKTRVVVKHVVDHVPVPSLVVNRVMHHVPAGSLNVRHVAQHATLSGLAHHQKYLSYDCDAGLSNSELGWSPLKKKWCCSHFRQGCDLSPTCGAACTLPGQPGGDNTCASSTRWASMNMFPGRSDACQLAFHEVMMNCDVCHGCHIQSTGCKVQDPRFGMEAHVPYNCSGAQIAWAKAKRVWCCQMHQRGCLSELPEQEDFAGSLHGQGETEAIPFSGHALTRRQVHAAFDCYTARSTWSVAQSIWCCNERGMGCEQPGQK